MRGKTFCHLKNSGNEVDVTNLSPEAKINVAEAAKLALFALKNLKFKHASLSLVFVSDAKIKLLNAKYLNHPWVTDVIAFPLVKQRQKGDRSETCPLFGEVIVSPEQAKLYAEKNDIPFHEELTRYICHGILHLKGYTDKSKRARQVMRKAESALIEAFEQETGIKRIV